MNKSGIHRSAWSVDRCKAIGPIRQATELTEQNLVNWIVGLEADARYARFHLAYGSPAVEMIARRIVDSQPMGPLHSIFTLTYSNDLGPNEWQVASI